jgi:predicted membrane channel-forming protein YqfA (hemolysin III family)
MYINALIRSAVTAVVMLLAAGFAAMAPTNLFLQIPNGIRPWIFAGLIVVIHGVVTSVINSANVFSWRMIVVYVVLGTLALLTALPMLSNTPAAVATLFYVGLLALVIEAGTIWFWGLMGWDTSREPSQPTRVPMR